MTKDDYTQLFNYIEQFRNEMKTGFEKAGAERNEIRASVIDLGIRLEEYHNEFLTYTHLHAKEHAKINNVLFKGTH